MTSAAATEVRDAVAAERGIYKPFDLCVWGLAEDPAAYDARC